MVPRTINEPRPDIEEQYVRIFQEPRDDLPPVQVEDQYSLEQPSELKPVPTITTSTTATDHDVRA